MNAPPGTYPVCDEMRMVAEEAEVRLGLGDALLDLGCGVGTIALTVAKMRDDVVIHGVDINEHAILAAKENGQDFMNVRFWQSDVFENVDERYEVIACTLPWEGESAYEIAPEPREAFITEDQGLARALAGAKDHLTPDGYFVMWGPYTIGKEVFPMVGLRAERYVYDADENCVVVGRAG